MDSMNGSLVVGNETISQYGGLSAVNIVVIVVDVILIIIICGGNLLTLTAVWVTPALRTVPNMYVVSLAVADLLAGLVIPYQMIIFFPGMQDALNNNIYLCLFRYSLFFVSAAESMLCLVAISIDRWLYISKPLRYVNLATPSRAGFAIAVTWCMSIFYGTVPLYNNKWTEATNCKLFNVLTQEYQVYVQGGSYFVCCVVCFIAYVNIFKIAYRQRRAIADMERGNSYRDRLKKAKSDWHLVKLFVLVFGVFFVCWTPTFLCLALGHTIGIPYVAMDIVGPISVLNSGMNFFIYAFKNSEFRQAFYRILGSAEICHKWAMNAEISVNRRDTTVTERPSSRRGDTNIFVVTPM